MRSIDAARIQTALSNSIVGHSIQYHQVLASTMDTARDLAHDGEREGAVVVAEEQNKDAGASTVSGYLRPASTSTSPCSSDRSATSFPA